MLRAILIWSSTWNVGTGTVQYLHSSGSQAPMTAESLYTLCVWSPISADQGQPAWHRHRHSRGTGAAHLYKSIYLSYIRSRNAVSTTFDPQNNVVSRSSRVIVLCSARIPRTLLRGDNLTWRHGKRVAYEQMMVRQPSYPGEAEQPPNH